ncbi:MAG: hypothetical protein ABSE59_09605 [Opitutaceae bacterium]|jgi:hypothetical protein
MLKGIDDRSTAQHRRQNLIAKAEKAQLAAIFAAPTPMPAPATPGSFCKNAATPVQTPPMPPAPAVPA